jgi:Methylamine utilisation protein MauE
VDLILLVACVLLALVFVVAGLAKLADRAGARQALRDFGVPTVLATPLGALLPLAELAVAVALLPTRSAWWGALGALVLLLLFVAGIGVNLARGRTPDCHCFGQLHSAPAGWPTLTRNVVQAAGAAFVVWHGRANVGPSAVSWPSTLTTVQWVSLIGAIVALLVLGLLAIEGWMLVQLVRQNGRLLVRLEAMEAHLGLGPTGSTVGLPVGTPAPPYGRYGSSATPICKPRRSTPMSAAGRTDAKSWSKHPCPPEAYETVPTIPIHQSATGHPAARRGTG